MIESCICHSCGKKVELSRGELTPLEALYIERLLLIDLRCQIVKDILLS